MFVKLYWVLPLFSALVWVSMLSAMIGYWCTIGRPHYPSMEATQTIAYISDVGAFKLNPLFIAMSTTAVVTLDASMIAERWLRHNGRLAPNTSFNQKWLDVVAIFFAIVGAVGFILLSIYNTYDYPTMHDVCLGVFIVGYVLSAIFLSAEYALLGRRFRSHPVLAASFWIKLAFIVIEVALAVTFVVLSDKERYNKAAILEWTVSFVFTFYIITFVMDLLPAVRTKHHMSHATVIEMGGADGRHNGYANGLHNVRSNGMETTYKESEPQRSVNY